jgi:hypothetical protein
MIFIDCEEVVRLHVADEIGAENQTGTNLPLHPNVHLDRTWGTVVRIKRRAIIESESLTQQRSQVVRVRRSRIKRKVGLILFLEGSNLAANNSDGHSVPTWCPAERWFRQHTSWDVYSLRICASVAGKRCLDEDVAQWRTEQRISRRYGCEHIFVEEPDAAAYRRLSLAGRIPGKTQLWREVQIRLPDPVAQPWYQRVEFRNGRKLAIAPARLPRVAHAIGQSQVSFQS